MSVTAYPLHWPQGFPRAKLRERGAFKTTLALVRASFAGFLALPAPVGGNWWEVLGVQNGAQPDVIKAAYRKLAAEHHPDRGGDPARMAAINLAYQQSGAL